MNKHSLKIGLFGYGCVGKGFYEVLNKTKSVSATIKTICIRDEQKTRDVDNISITTNPSIILEDPEIDVVIELIDDSVAAFEIVSSALKKGKAVVSANKKMIAEHFHELLALQQEHQVPFLYEAACCAGIPIIRSLEEYYDNDMLQSIKGIVNGSTNYILTKTFQEHIPYEIALKQAQLEGYAESNPQLDVSGEDAKNKLLILVAHAFGLVLKPEDIFTIGIDTLGSLEWQYAIEKGYKIKLIAHAWLNQDNQLSGLVMPQFIQSNEKLYHVDEVYNGVATSTYFSDAQFFVGKGAGAYPTASAVLSDLSALSYQYRYGYKKIKTVPSISWSSDFYVKILLRHAVAYNTYLSQYFVQVEERYQKEDVGYLVGTISIKQLDKLLKQFGDQLSAVLFEPLNLPLPEAFHHHKTKEEVVF